MATVTVGGQEFKLAPLKSLQVAAFFDEIGKRTSDTPKVEVFASSLRVIAQSLGNAKDPFVDGLSVDDAMVKIDDLFPWKEVDTTFGAVIEITGLKKSTPGEVPAAAESTSSESTAA